MKLPDLHPFEPQRLATLRKLDILDTPPEERFDRMTRLAQRLFDVQIALVTLVDSKRQWFKSAVGLTEKETPRDVSFCAHAILGNEVMVVPDARADPRFADNPFVTNEPHVRFYAGCPLKTPDGMPLGTLCLVDQRPRQFHGEDILALRDLAAMVQSELVAIQLATLDELTGISNRRGFLQLARHALAFCLRHDLPATLVVLDMDGFKQVNDRFGHAEGDLALRAFASLIKQSFRDSDCFGRLGGDEFAVFLTNTESKQAEEVSARFASAIEAYNKSAGRGYALASTQGLINFDPDRHDSLEALLAEGDALMYARKQARH